MEKDEIMENKNSEEKIIEEKTPQEQLSENETSKEGTKDIEPATKEILKEEKSEAKNKKSKTKKEKTKEPEKKEKKERATLSQKYDKIQGNIPALIITFFASIFIMAMVCVAVFSMNLKGSEKVLVPNVVGKNWDEALLEMQVKELYPKINLRYSNTIGDEGKILEQSPEAGAIVKGYSRVSLVISRGVLVDEVDNYIGRNIDEVKMSLQTLFAGQTKPLINLAEPQYKPDLSEPGTILEQDPPPETKISQPVTVNLIVSRGPNYENTRRPYVIGQSINDLLQTIARSKIVFEISGHEALDNEKPGTVTKQQQITDEYIPNYSRVTVEMAMPKNSSGDTVSGIFQTKLADYPYPLSMRLEAVPADGAPYTILNFNHPGGLLTLPYSVTRGTTLVLYVVDKVNARYLVE